MYMTAVLGVVLLIATVCQGTAAATTSQSTSSSGSSSSSAMLRQQWIYVNSTDFSYNHMSTIAQINSSYFVVAWQASRFGEGHDDQRIRITHSSDTGETWAEPKNVFDPEPDFVPYWGPALFYHHTQGKLYLYYSRSLNATSRGPGRYHPGGSLYVTTSEDLGVSWTPGRLLLDFWSLGRGNIAKMTANKPIFVDGSFQKWIIPFWQQTEKSKNHPAQNTTGPPCAGVMRTIDGGKTYTAHGFIHSVNYSFYTIEPSAILPDGPDSGTVLQYFRTENVGKIYQSVSTDFGASWSPIVETTINNPDSKVYLAARVDYNTKETLSAMVSYNPTEPWSHHSNHVLVVSYTSNPKMLSNPVNGSDAWGSNPNGSPILVLQNHSKTGYSAYYPTVIPVIEFNHDQYHGGGKGGNGWKGQGERDHWMISYTNEHSSASGHGQCLGIMIAFLNLTGQQRQEGKV